MSREREVDRLMNAILEAASDLARDTAGIETSVELEVSSALGASPRVVQEIVGSVDGAPRVSVEDKAPAVGEKHFGVLISQAQQPGGWKIPRVSECTKLSGTAELLGAVSIVSKLSYFLTDEQSPHHYAILHDARCLHLLVKRNANYPNFFISPPISLDDPRLFHVLTHLFLWDPPSSLEDGYDPPDDPPVPNSPESPPPPMYGEDISAGFATVLHRFKDRPHKSTYFHITHYTETIGPIVVSSFDNAPSRATVMHGMLGSNPIVIKLAEQDRDNDMKEEGEIYRTRLRGIEGVPKVYAEGWLWSNEHWVYCLVLQDLGVPLTEEGIQSIDEIHCVPWVARPRVPCSALLG
ncbi:hypothetical protein C8R46DRAFT_1229147 [Mycena filopes]|nr:hypothetical protein C8R46DRAFT_1229147 [Mycena filopes]